MFRRLAVLLCPAALLAQGPPQGPPRTPRASAPVDFTGMWVSLITEDWRHRMMTPPKGDTVSIPLNPAGVKAAAAWDPAADESAMEQCRAYGAGGVMRLPGRLRISWQDDNTLKVETDAGSQTRRLQFGAPQGDGNDWQGISQASWDFSLPTVSQPFGPPPGLSAGGYLRVVTTRMKPGYVRKNGVPYSAGAALTEYWDRFDVPGGDILLVISSQLTDPTYYGQPYWTSSHFKKQTGEAGWNPTPCSAR